MRENYLKVFEWAVKKGGSNGAMSSFNRIGFTWSGASYALLTELLRGEWGFEGVVITDAHAAGQGCMNANQMLRAGNDMSLDSREGSIARVVNTEESNTATQLTALHNACKHILYTQLNSAAMNNGYAMESLPYSETSVNAAGATVNVEPGQEVNLSVADENDADARYVLFYGTLPEGLTFDAATATVSGTVAETAKGGAYAINIVKTQHGIDAAGEDYLVNVDLVGGFGGFQGVTVFTFNVLADGFVPEVQAQ